jgi:Kef-type K+ transport system membrane component KefB
LRWKRASIAVTAGLNFESRGFSPKLVRVAPSIGADRVAPELVESFEVLDALRSHILTLPDLAKFAVIIAAIVGVPRLAAWVRVPPMVGLLLFGVLLGPHVLGFFGEHRPVPDFFGELGKLLLMFSAGLEIDIALFRRAQTRAIIFGLMTTSVPLLFGTFLGLGFGDALIPAIVVGSLLASHTLLSVPIVQRLSVIRLEPIVVTIGATVLSDTLSLVVFAV